MLDVIAAQRVERRKYSSVHARIYRIDQIKQHPARKKRARLKKSGGVRRHLAAFLNVFSKKKEAESGIRQGSAFFNGELKNAVPQKAAFLRRTTASKKTGGKSASPLKIFLGKVILLLALLAAAAWLLFAVDWSWARITPDAPLIEAPEDALFEQDMISYVGLLPQETRDQGGEEIPLDMMETFKWQSYRVKKGDSVFKIAQDHALSMDAVIASNGMTNAKKLYEGQELKIPNMDGIPYTVKRGDSLLKISGSMGVPLTAILDANDIESDDINPGTVLFIPGARMKTEDLKLALGEFFKYPIRGKLSSPFGWRNDPFTGVRRYHAAIDLAAPTGTTVKASMDGRVTTVGYNATYGKFIILSHSNNFQSLYAHLNAASVSQGAYVSQGAKIGEVGSTGYSTGPHLHFAVYKNGRSVNPLDFLNSGL
ncbi:MAG: M23 family metallopeptidase [Treponema sp.]|nr:M23 family metallopeptidase [Treponema sp.]